MAATLGGLSQPSPFVGGGMPALEDEEYDAQFREKAGTGILYTPPQLSDHVAISLVLSGSQASADLHVQKDATTLRCQPHRSSKRITDFFTKRQDTSTPSELPPAKRKAVNAS